LIASLIVLLVQGFVHIGHFLKIEETKANKILIIFSILGTFLVAVFTLIYVSKKLPMVGIWLLISFLLAFLIEVLLRHFTGRVVTKQT